MWAYPWDLLDEGVESVADRLSDLGVTEVALATNYHTVQTYHPHNPERRTFFAHPSSYFQPADEDYGRLQPVPNEVMGDDDWLARITEEIADTHLSLSSWTIGCHNSRLGMANRDLTLTSPYGDDLVFGLCPSNPDVQAYLTNLLADLDGRAPFERIELEQFDYFYGTGFGWHHEKFHTQLGDLGEFLFGLCFCEHCREHAADDGVDVERARADAVDALDALTEGELPHTLDVGGWLFEHPAVMGYALARTETLGTVFERLDDAVGGADLGYYVGQLGVEDSWKFGVDFDRLDGSLDYYTALAYESTPEAAADCVRTAKSLTDTPVHAGLMPAHPVLTDGETLAGVVDGVVDAGAERVSFYNYGLLPERNLGWVGDALAPHRSD